MGSTGVELNIPVSRRFSEYFTAHVNMAAALFNRVTAVSSTGATYEYQPLSYSIGASWIWLATGNANFLVEYLMHMSREADEFGSRSFQSSHIVNPGVRVAINSGDVQIVPAVGLPIRFQEGASHLGSILYLSVEHGF